MATTHHSIGLFWCGSGYGMQGSCKQDPFNVGGGDVVFGYMAGPTSSTYTQMQNPPNNFATTHPEWVDLIENEATKALQKAFSQYPAISVQVGSKGDQTCAWFFTCHNKRNQEHTVFVIGEWSNTGQGGQLVSLFSSLVYYPVILANAEEAVKDTGGIGTPTFPPMTSTDLSNFQTVLRALGRGIGNTAAHELGHQLTQPSLPNMDCGNDTSNPDAQPCDGNYNFVYNFFNGYGGNQIPSDPNSVGASFKYVDVPGFPIRWGTRACKAWADYAEPGSSSRTDCP